MAIKVSMLLKLLIGPICILASHLTSVDTKSKVGVDTASDPCPDPTFFRSLAGTLQYLTFTRPNISYAVQQICLHMHDLRAAHMQALKRVLRYVQGTISLDLYLRLSSASGLKAYSDADWGGCLDTRRSTFGYCVFLGNNLVSWSVKRQPTLSRFSAEAEYRGVSNVVSESCWLRNLLRELHCPISTATLVYCDNVSAIYLSGNPVQHQRVKHIEMDIHFFVKRLLGIKFVFFMFLLGIRLQISSPKDFLFDDFRDSLNVQSPTVLTAGV